MKHLMSIVLSIAFLSGVCYADEGLGLKDQKDRESYSLGYQFGQYLQSRGWTSTSRFTRRPSRMPSKEKSP